MALANNKDFRQENYCDATYDFFKILGFKIVIPFMNLLTARVAALKFGKLFRSADIIHCRGHIGTAFGLNVVHALGISKPIIADIRGALVDEFSRNPSRRSQILACFVQQTEHFVFQNIRHFFFVSDSMRDYYCNLYNFDTKQSCVFPTMVNTNLFHFDQRVRMEMRSRLKLEDRVTLFFYSGGISYWQKVDVLFRAFGDACRHREDIYLLIITKDLDEVCKIAALHNIPRRKFNVISSDYDKMGRFLNAGDVGLLIRDRTITNLVACPVKLGEYLSCGLRVLTTIRYSDSNRLIIIENDQESLIKAFLTLRHDDASHGPDDNFVSRFDLGRVVEEQISAYRGIISERSHTDRVPYV